MAPAKKRCIQNIVALGWRSHLLCLAAFLGIIIVVGSSLPGSPSVDARGIAGPFLSTTTTLEIEGMDPRDAAVNEWLRKVGFVYDRDLGHVRNPFGYPRGEADPALEECFVSPEFEPSPFTEIEKHFGTTSCLTLVGPPGSGKSAILAMFVAAQNQTPVVYQNPYALIKVLRRVLCNLDNDVPTLSASCVNVFLDLDKTYQIPVSVMKMLFDMISDIRSRTPNMNVKIVLPHEISKVDLPGFFEYGEFTWNNFDSLLRARFSWASGGKFEDLKELCDTRLQFLVESPHEQLAQIARTPRHLFELGQELFRIHIEHSGPSPDSLLQEIEWGAFGERVRSLNILPQPTPDVQYFMLRQEPPEPLRLSLEFYKIDAAEIRMRVRMRGKSPDQEKILDSQVKKDLLEPAALTLILQEIDAGLRQDYSYERKPVEDDVYQTLGIGNMEFLQGIGKNLYEMIPRHFLNELDKRLDKQSNYDFPLSLHLYFEADVESNFPISLASYPWELMHDGRIHLINYYGGRGINLIRHVEHDRPVDDRCVGKKKPLPHVLYIAPRLGTAALEELGLVEFSPGEWDAIPSRIKSEQNEAEVRSLSDLRDKLDAIPDINILHFDGHGIIGRKCRRCGAVARTSQVVCPRCKNSLNTNRPPSGYLLFEDEENGRSYQAVSRGKLTPLLSNKGIHLVFLSTCRSATIPGGSVFNAVAPGLLIAGVLSVIGMQFPIELEMAKRFSTSFYEELMATGSTTRATLKGRESICTTGHWFVPVLYLQGNDYDGEFFQPIK